MAWLYVPRPHTSPSAPASEGSTSDSTPPSQDWSLWCTSSGKPMPRPSSWPGWKRRPYHKRLSGTTCAPSTLALWWASWISSLAERRAPSSVSPTLSENSTQTSNSPPNAAASSGSKSASPSSARPLSSSGRTSPEQLALFPLSPPTSTPAATSPSSGLWCERVTWERPMSELASSSWPTPNTGESANGHGRRGGRAGNGHQSGKDLEVVARESTPGLSWPTPAARDWKSGEHSEEMARRNARPLSEVAWAFSRPDEATAPPGPESSPSAPTSPRLQLNPDFVDWVMGWESGWTCACARGRTGSVPRATESSPNKPPSLGESSGPRCASGS